MMGFPQKQRELTAEQARDMHQFAVRLQAATPRVWVVYALIGLNVAVWIVQLFYGVNATSPGARTLFDWGGNLGNAVYAGEYWRLLSSTALHGGILHLAMNMYALYAIGPTVEKVQGNAGFAATYLVAGIAGSVASAIATPNVVSVGASGAVFGILGAQLTGLLAPKVGLPDHMRSGVLRQGLIFIGLNLWIGFSIPNIDNAAHIGGLVAGGLCGFLLAHSHTRTGVAGRGRRAAVVCVAGLVLLGLTLSLWPRTDTDADTGTAATVSDLPQRLNQADSATVRLYGAVIMAETLSSAEGLEAIAPVIEDMRRLKAEVESSRSGDKSRRYSRLIEARLEYYEALASYFESPTRETKQLYEEARERAEAALSAVNKRR